MSDYGHSAEEGPGCRYGSDVERARFALCRLVVRAGLDSPPVRLTCGQLELIGQCELVDTIGIRVGRMKLVIQDAMRMAILRGTGLRVLDEQPVAGGEDTDIQAAVRFTATE